MFSLLVSSKYFFIINSFCILTTYYTRTHTHHRVKGYTRCNRQKEAFRIYSQDHQRSRSSHVRLSVRMNAEISETIRARLLRLGMQIPELLTQRKFVSAMCHAHSNAHKPPKNVAPTIFSLVFIFENSFSCKTRSGS